jgi:hypothetical protein
LGEGVAKGDKLVINDAGAEGEPAAEPVERGPVGEEVRVATEVASDVEVGANPVVEEATDAVIGEVFEAVADAQADTMPEAVCGRVGVALEEALFRKLAEAPLSKDAEGNGEGEAV